MSIQHRSQIQFASLAAALLLGVVGCKPGEEQPPEDTYMFSEDEPSAFNQIDRHGMPAVNVALITDKDAYNMAGPEATADYVADMTATVTAFHMALDDDITGAGLIPCVPDACIQQAAPHVVPDTLKIDTTMAAGFPNGRLLSDPVMDVTLALLLLDLSMGGQTATSLVGVLNPAANDVPFEAAFPYVAAKHE
jgi:hypothetical protein